MNLEGEEIKEGSERVEENIGGEKKENLSKEMKQGLIRDLEKTEKAMVNAIGFVKKDLRELYVNEPNGKNFIDSTLSDIDDAQKQAEELILELKRTKEELKNVNKVKY